jgi:hypothetical protein
MRKRVLIVVAALALAMAVITPVIAITGGQPDGDGHPYSGLVIGDIPGQPGYIWICSGTLIAEDVVLTAGHCTANAEASTWVQATFDSEGPFTWYTASGVATHPGYDEAAWPFTLDYGLVFLEEAPGITPATLPEPGVLPEMIGTTGQTDWRFVDVGYGQNGVIVGGGPPVPNFDFVRKYSVQRYHPGQGAVGAQDPTWFVLNNVPSKNHGSGCGGDSGSGIFPDADDAFGDTVLAVHTGGYRLGNAGQICGRITSLNHRVDIDVVLDWIAESMP